MQKCYASISDTGLHCAWCITREVLFQGLEIDEAFCEKHNKPCEELGYYCSDFIGYKPDYRMTDEEEQKFICSFEDSAKWELVGRLVDKIEPKFHEGDWIVRDGKTLQISHIDKVLDGTFHYWFTKGTWLSSAKMEDARLWNIQDAKEGADVSKKISGSSEIPNNHTKTIEKGGEQ